MNLPGTITRIKSSDHDDEGCYHEGCSNRPEWRVQGETDSMGAEYEFFCDEHIGEERKRLEDASEVEHECDRCGSKSRLYPSRDWEEGMNGPVYHWCGGCRAANAKSLEDSMPDDHFLLDDEDDDDYSEEDYENDRQAFELQEAENDKVVYGFVTNQNMVDCEVIKGIGVEHLFWDGFVLDENKTGVCGSSVSGDLGPYRITTWAEYNNGDLELTMAFKNKEEAQRIPPPADVMEMALHIIGHFEKHVATPVRIKALPNHTGALMAGKIAFIEVNHEL